MPKRRWISPFLSALVIGLSLPVFVRVASAMPPESGPSGPIHAIARYPSIHNDTVVFEAGGNLWKVGISGGIATRLTSDSGYDFAPAFSPNGKWIAFTGWFQGNTDVYVISSEGGPVRRLTFHSMNNSQGGKLAPVSDNLVMGWTRSGKDVVFLSRRHSINPQMFQAYKVPLKGGLPQQLPLPWTGPLSFNASGTEVAYNRLSDILSSFHRKHYFAGQATKIYLYNLKTGAGRKLTGWKGANTWPMWRGNTLYFASDRGPNNVLNLWSYSFQSKTYRQITHFKTYGVDWPRMGNSGIAFSDGGKLYVLKLPSETLVSVPVTIPLDGSRIQPHWYNASQMIRSASLAPNGTFAAFGARGDVFVVPSKHGDTLDITNNQSAREKNPAWSPNGKEIAYITDATGHSEIALRQWNGKGEPRYLTKTSGVLYRGNIAWSPNGRWITYTDSKQVLWLEDVRTGKRYQLASNPYHVLPQFQNVSWSPDSRWIAFSNTLPNQLNALFIYNVESHKMRQVSKGGFSDSEPAFSKNGKYLYFVSQRLANPTMSNFDFTMASLDSDGLYVTTLKATTPSPFAPRHESPVPKSGKSSNHRSHGSHHKLEVRIDFKGLMNRAIRVPVPAANIEQVAGANGVVFYYEVPNMTLGGPLPGETAKLRAYDLSKRKAMTIADNVAGGFAVSSDGAQLLFNSQGKWILRSSSFMQHAKATVLNVSHMKMWVVPREEWAEVFGEAVRDVRNYFISADYINKKWPGIVARYKPLLKLAADRQDVNWILGNMIGSLGESHMYVFGGAHGWQVPFAPSSDLGANFGFNAKTGRYYLSKIFRGDNMIPGYRAPLSQPGLKVREGDYVLAINGHPLKAPMNPYQLLLGTYGTTVRLTLAGNAAGRHPWTIRVRPIATGQKIRMLAWIRHNRKVVNRLSHGKIGYVYLEDMETTGMRQFVRQYYSQMQKKALVFDDRWNLGGFIDPVLFDRLTRRIAGMFVNRHGKAQPTPNGYPGYMAALINHGSASDGDIFAYMFKFYHLGPTIGTRTWGGVRGYSAPFTLMDGGHLVVSEDAMYGTNSKWIVENIGVEPNIHVMDSFGALNKGQDLQLKTAVKYLMKEIKRHPKSLPPPPPWTPFFPPQPAYPKCPSLPVCG